MGSNHKNSGGNTMSLSKSVSRRLSLLTGPSLIAVGLSLFAFGGAVAVPTAALAANECTPVGVPPTANGTAPDSYTCAATTYATGITYDSAGNLTVTKTNTTTTTVTANGVNLTGNGPDSVTWDSSAGTVVGGAGTAGPVIDVTTGSGAINITTIGVTAFQTGATHAIRATSASGAINITRVAGGAAVNNGAATGLAAIEAVTGGGNISIIALGNVTGRARGIVAQTSGAGAVTMTLGGATTAHVTEGIAAIDATAGTGGVNIAVTAGSVNNTAGHAFVIKSTGGAVITNAGTIGSVTNFQKDVSGGRVDFSGMTGGGVTFTHSGTTASSGRWFISGTNTFSGGNDVLTMSGSAENRAESDSIINFGAGNDTFSLGNLLALDGAATFDFGAGTDTFNISGILANTGLTVSNLEALNLSGTIFMGTGTVGNVNPLVDPSTTDSQPDDVLSIAGATWTGSGSGRVIMDVLLDPGGDQPGCATLSGVADCLDLRDSSTAGVTMLTVNYVGEQAVQGGSSGITLVDVGGAGTSAAGHFILDPNSSFYAQDPLFGAIIARPGLFNYALRYDPENQRHVLVGVPRREVLEYSMLTGAAQSIWHMTTETVTDRQNDLRGGTEGVMWMRATGEYSKRDVETGFDTFGDTFAVDNSYKLYAATIMGGMDLVSGRSGDYDYVLGAQIGYVSSSFDLTDSPTSGRFSGATGGLYGSVWSQRLFLDGTFNLNGLTLDYDTPGLASKTNTYTNAVGARLDGGMRFMMTERTFIEPLATLAFVQTSFEEISLDGGEVQPADASSRRGALGARIGAELTEGPINVGYFVAGRAWREFDGSSEGVVHNPGADMAFADEFSGGFGEAEAGVSLYNEAGTLTGYLSSGVRFTDGYSATNLSLGLSMRW